MKSFICDLLYGHAGNTCRDRCLFTQSPQFGVICYYKYWHTGWFILIQGVDSFLSSLAYLIQQLFFLFVYNLSRPWESGLKFSIYFYVGELIPDLHCVSTGLPIAFQPGYPLFLNRFMLAVNLICGVIVWNQMEVAAKKSFWSWTSRIFFRRKWQNSFRMLWAVTRAELVGAWLPVHQTMV